MIDWSVELDLNAYNLADSTKFRFEPLFVVNDVTSGCPQHIRQIRLGLLLVAFVVKAGTVLLYIIHIAIQIGGDFECFGIGGYFRLLRLYKSEEL